MTKPTASQLRADTRIDWTGRFGLTSTPPPDMLEFEIDLAWVALEETTGQDFESMAAKWDPIILQATKYQVVYQAASGRGDFSSLVANASGIQSFTVPGYSETRASVQNVSQGRNYIFHQWEPLDRLIWLLATQAKRDEALALAKGKHTPFVGFVAPDEELPLFGIERELYG